MVAVSIAIFAVGASGKLGVLYAFLGLTCTLALVLFSLEAVLSESKPMFIGCQACEMLFTWFVILESWRNGVSLGPVWTDVHLPLMIVKIVFQVAVLGLFMPVWKSMTFYNWKVAGANVTIRRIWKRFRFFLALIKFDLFASLLLLFMVDAYLVSSHDVDFALGIVTVVLSIVFFVMAWLGITLERRRLVWASLAVGLWEPGFIAYKAAALRNEPDLVPPNCSLPQFIILGSLTVALRLAVAISMFRCMCVFGQGLKTVVFARGQAGYAAVGGGAAGSLLAGDLLGDDGEKVGGVGAARYPDGSAFAPDNYTGELDNPRPLSGQYQGAAAAATAPAAYATGAGSVNGMTEEVLTASGTFRPASGLFLNAADYGQPSEAAPQGFYGGAAATGDGVGGVPVKTGPFVEEEEIDMGY